VGSSAAREAAAHPAAAKPTSSSGASSARPGGKGASSAPLGGEGASTAAGFRRSRPRSPAAARPDGSWRRRLVSSPGGADLRGGRADSGGADLGEAVEDGEATLAGGGSTNRADERTEDPGDAQLILWGEAAQRGSRRIARKCVVRGG